MDRRSSTSSLASTPAKKRKVAVMWEALLKDVDSALIPKALNLMELLSSTVQADDFIQTPTSCQRYVLECLLGEHSELIESIIQSVESNIHKPISDVDKLYLCLLAPSAPLEEKSFTAVARALLQLEGNKIPIAEYADIRKFMFSTPYQPPQTSGLDLQTPATSSETSSVNDFIASLATKFERNMLYMREKEASGYPLFGTFAVYLADELSTYFPGHEFKADMEFSAIAEKLKSGKKPSSDGAICVIPDIQDKKPLILYEYKPTVDMRKEHVYHQSLMEVLIQTFYCLKQHKVSTIIQCLTDLHQWYYFKVEKVGSTKLKYTWYKSVHEPMLSLKVHIDFLYPVIKDMLE